MVILSSSLGGRGTGFTPVNPDPSGKKRPGAKLRNPEDINI